MARTRAAVESMELASVLISNLPPPSELGASLTAQWQSVQPHFGTRAVSDALASWQHQLPGGLQMPSVQMPSMGGEGLHGLSASARGGFSSVRNAVGAMLPSGPPGGFSVQFSAPSFSPSDTASAFTQAAAPLMALLDTSSAASALPPHFGTLAAQQAVTSTLDLLAQWAGVRLVVLQRVDPQAAASMTEAVAVLQQLGVQLATLPAADLLSPEQLSALGALVAAVRDALSSTSSGAGADPQALLAAAGQRYAQLQGRLSAAGIDAAALALLSAATLTVGVLSTPPEGYQGPAAQNSPDLLPCDYDPSVLSDYFSRRPLAVARRSAQVALEASLFGAALLLDIWMGRVKENEPARAIQLRESIQTLGATYIKVAQALSTRVDLLAPAYLAQIQLLQDRVQPFPCSEARQVIESSLGRKIEDMYATLSDKPVAAASLGQVYRATLRPELGGGDVAIKVLRPGVLEQVSLDLHIVRGLAMAASSQSSVDWPGIIDDWAVRFIHEMDYAREADNAETFRRDLAGLQGILIAPVRFDLSTGVVLTTQWVEGEKLSESRSGDVRSLCTTLLNAYLIQLLDTGFLHADPHPGNLIRTPNGQICILDYGLTTQVTPQQRLALVEFIAYMCTEDWLRCTLALQSLGFIPANVNVNDSGLVAPLGAILVQLLGGGGAAKLNIDKIIGELEQLGRTYPFQIPPFFALVLRAFSVIEGIALTVDPEYAIVTECFPYIAKRLLSADDPAVHALLREVLYGNKQRLDVNRLMRLADSLSSFTTDGLIEGSSSAAARAAAGPSADADADLPVYARASSGGFTNIAAVRSGGMASSTALASVSRQQGLAPAARAPPLLSPVVIDTLRSVLSVRGSYLQELLIDEAVAAVDALSREAMSAILRSLLASGPARLSRNTLEALGPLRSVLLPVPTPLELLARLEPAVSVTQEDREALAVLQGLLALTQRLNASASVAAAASGGLRGAAGSAANVALVDGRGAGRAARAMSELSPLAPELLPGVLYTGERFVRALMRRMAQRIAEGMAQRSMAALGLGLAAQRPQARVQAQPPRAAPARSNTGSSMGPAVVSRLATPVSGATYPNGRAAGAPAVPQVKQPQMRSLGDQ